MTFRFDPAAILVAGSRCWQRSRGVCGGRLVTATPTGLGNSPPRYLGPANEQDAGRNPRLAGLRVVRASWRSNGKIST